METFKFIDFEQASTKISKEEPIIVDIRDKDSFDRGHIDGALNLSNDNIDKFVLDTEKNNCIIVCCYHGNSSQRAAQFLTDKGFNDVYSLNGGYEHWKTLENKQEI